MDEAEAKRLVELYADMIVRISYSYLKRTCDAEDICQTVFLKCLTERRVFDSQEHEKAWMIRAAINACKDTLKSAFFRRTVPLDEARELSAPPPESDLLEAVKSLPKKYAVSLYLYYYEEYSAKEIAALLGTRENTVSAWLSRGRRKLKAILSDDEKGAAKYAG